MMRDISFIGQPVVLLVGYVWTQKANGLGQRAS